MFKFFKIASAASLCGALMVITPTAEAALVNYTFSGVVDSGSLIGANYNGNFAYDNATLTNSGSEAIDLSSLSVNFLSSAYNIANADFTSTADFLDGVFLGINYSASILNPSFTLGSGLATGSPTDAYFSYQTVDGDSGFGSLIFAKVTSVPLPAAVWLFGSALAGFGAFARRKRRIAL